MASWLTRAAGATQFDELHTITERSRVTFKTRVVTFLFVAGCLFISGVRTEALIYALALIPVEAMISYTCRRVEKNKTQLRPSDVILLGASECFSSFFFVSLGLLALLSPSPSVHLMGILWIIGTLNYTSINFAKWQYFNFLNIVPAALGLIAFAILAGQAPMRVSTPVEWWIGIFGAVLLLATTFELIVDQRKTERELEVARLEAAERLEALEFSASHDDLTSLLNRSAFNERLDQQLRIFRDTGESFALLLLDLDGFKPINDTFGHPAGDALLAEVSGRLRNTVGRDGSVARVGGDEFGIILKNAASEDAVEDIILDLIRIISLPVKYQEAGLSVGTSIGVAHSTEVLSTAERLIAAADQALYKAKESKRSSFVTYHPEMARISTPLAERERIENAIKKMLIRPYYQPKFCLRTRDVLGFEALARWPKSPKQPSDTAAFIATIEEIGLLSEFTYRIAKQVFADVNGLLKEGLDPGQVSINLPEVTLATVNGIEDLEWLLAENPLVVPHITLEITEDVFISRAGTLIRENIETLRKIGVRISLDDFGTGFASFQHLRQLEFDELKIDTEFVRGLGIDPTANVIVDGFLSIAQGLSVDVVAEGVETEAQRSYLLERGCPVGQGFLHSKAQPLADIRRYLIREADEKATG